MSAAGSLRQALNLPAGLNDKRVLGCPDDLSYGPINSPDPAARIQWLNRLLGGPRENPSHDEPQDDLLFWSGRIAGFWRDFLDPGTHPVLWVCRRNAAEYAGFLEMVLQLGDAPCDIIDLSDLTIDLRRHNGETSRWQVLGTGTLSPEQIVSHSLPDRRVAISPRDRAKWQNHWRKLQTENAPLRVIMDGALQSAPIDFFDDFLLSHATSAWRKSARIIGDALARQEDRWSALQAGDQILWARLRQLALEGCLEYRGDVTDLRASEMRHP